ncbi:zinc finger CCCH domain-containing protein 64 [Capsella rubella]|uniref:zinc finger CCCH domain-containing protein 64 n=1 Tax=Capsella rubella TaxID=81985 RepID=UPI000CD5A23E|nr:zinc finger CCCH domain-containing protein 64 [Capsella rubella]XP_023645494.1 zinc finger CCCH domain-containing protein 64 [Capsella rubella]XP_023645498.1 zinc finger CCCH domain-containing protein 64 [Capsella rubella]XP_023645503.1 zinc finger CCCH domain-containing protein 64 [Capsella rubella]
MAPRILLCGDPLGRLNQLFKRVQSVSKSAGQFDALICVGQFFPDSSELLDEFLDYVEGRAQVPIPTYFTGDYGVVAPKILSTTSKKAENQGFKMDGLEVCHNLFWLRGSGKFTLHGLSVAYLSGRQSSDSQFGKYNQDDVDALRALAEESGVVDLFLTNEWPAGVTNRAAVSDIPAGVSDSSCSDFTVSELVMEIKPRYHIAGSMGVFYAREPYLNADSTHVTRFIGLAQVGNKNKQKFLHALSPTPTSTMSPAELSAKPTNTTLPPYTLRDGAAESKKRPNDSDSDSQYWRYDVPKRQKNGSEGGKLCFKFVCSGSCQRGENCHFQHNAEAREQCRRGVCLDLIIKGKCEKGPECSYKHEFQNESIQRKPRSENANRSKECWFCLSSPSVESHLIVSVGESFYCALPKGSLVEDHILIIPIEHLPNTLVLSPEVESELSRYQNGLRNCYKSQGNDAVFFELVSKRVSHANLQVVPVPSSRARLLPNIFSLAAEKLGFKLVTKKFSDSSDGRKYLQKEYNAALGLFYVELPDGTVLSHTLEENEVFPAQFGREVLAGLLKIPDRADWRNCKISQEEEGKLAEDFKKQFQEFDPCQ